VFYNNADSGNHLVKKSVFQRQVFASGLLCRLITGCVFRFISLKACVFEKYAAFWKNRIFLIHYLFVMFFSFISTAKVYCFSGDNIGNDVIFYRMALFFTTVIAFLIFLLLWTLDFSFGTVDYEGKLKTFFQSFLQGGWISFRQV